MKPCFLMGMHTTKGVTGTHVLNLKYRQRNRLIDNARPEGSGNLLTRKFSLSFPSGVELDVEPTQGYPQYPWLLNCNELV